MVEIEQIDTSSSQKRTIVLDCTEDPVLDTEVQVV